MATRAKHQCGKCGRRVRVERCVYSRWTRERYCFPGEGCERAKRKKVKA